jgi:succinoglycan biosynthesis transport protein ExoP
MTLRMIVRSSAAGAALAKKASLAREAPPWNVPEEVRERFRRMRASLGAAEQPDFCVALTSTVGGEGVSWVSAMLSCAIAEEEQDAATVSLLDLNRQNPSQCRIFGANSSTSGRVEGSNGLVVHETPWPNISVLTPDPHRADALPSSPSWLRQTVAHLRPKARAVVIDCESMRDSSQVLDLAPALDGVLFVVEAERERRQAVERCLESIRRSKMPILGVVLNKRSRYLPDPLYNAL